MQFEEEDDHVYLAYCFPYTYSDLQQYLALLDKVSQPKQNNTRSRRALAQQAISAAPPRPH